MAFVGKGVCMECGEPTWYISSDVRRCERCWKDFVWDRSGLVSSDRAELPDIPPGKLLVYGYEEELPDDWEPARKITFPEFEEASRGGIIMWPAGCLKIYDDEEVEVC